jgi:hypothetical protein
VLVGDPSAEQLKSFWYKVRCKVCGDLFMLCLPRKNLSSNLESHIQGLKHTKALEDAARSGRSTSSALLTRMRGKPTASSRKVTSG